MPQDARFWESIGKSAECPLQIVGLGTGSEMVDGSLLVKGLHSRQPMFLVSGNTSPETKVMRFPGVV